MLAAQTPNERIERIVLPDGRAAEFLSCIFPLPTEGDEPDCVGGVALDITAHRQAERLLAEYNQTLEAQVAEQIAELRSREASFACLLANLPGAAYRCRFDEDCTVTATTSRSSRAIQRAN